MASLAIQIFVNGLCDHKIQKTFRIVRHKTFIDVLSTALEFKAATLAFGGYSKVRTIKEREAKKKFDQTFTMIKSIIEKMTKTIKCWNNGEISNVRSSRKT